MSYRHRIWQRIQRHFPVLVVEPTMFLKDALPTQPNRRRLVIIHPAYHRLPILQLVDQTLAHQRVLIQVHKMRHLLRREHPDVVLLDGDPEFLERLLTLDVHLLRLPHLLLERLRDALHQLLARLHLVLQLGFCHGLERAVLGLVGDLLLLGRNRRVEGTFAHDAADATSTTGDAS
jgi:hypothetical protein